MPERRGGTVIGVNAGLDAVVVGSGPNGLAAAVTLARAGRSVVVLEANETFGGGARTMELTEPGFRHDVASAIHPLGRGSPFFRSVDLESHGLRWVTPPAAAAHPLDGGRAAICWNDLEHTVDQLGSDGNTYRRYYERWVRSFDSLTDLALKPLLRLPRRPVFAASFGAVASLPAATTANRIWEHEHARALFLGHAAHSILPLTKPFTSTFGVLLGASAHAVGWPFPAGGAQAITDALISVARGLGVELRAGHEVESMDDIPESRAVIFSLTPRQVEHIAGERFPTRYRNALRAFRYGAAAWKVDFALDEPIPWSDPDVRHAGTVHVCGSPDEVVGAEADVAAGRHPERPFVLLAQHSNFDTTRAPDGKYTAWAYCHVPNGSTVDRTEAIERQIERFAPGFLDTVRARHVTGPIELESQNANLVGGDIGGGSYSGRQLFARPRPQRNPFRTPDARLFIGSASTTPGAGVHGMAGWGAAEQALATVLK